MFIKHIYVKIVNLCMSTLKVEILNPKAAKLLKDLADMNLITINKFPENNFSKALARFRTKEKKPSLADITAEVEIVRAKRHDQ
jgi:hypothetical protein